MSTTIVMPQLGESVAEGVIGKWLKNEGDHVAKDEAIVEVITDKVNAEIPSPVTGTLERIAQPEGATVAVGQEIAVIGHGGHEGSAHHSHTHTSGAPVSSGSEGGGRPHFGDSNGGAVATAAAGSYAATQTPSSNQSGRGERVRSSPLVRRMAEQHGINLAEVPGTGIGGRVSKQDILQYVEQQGAKVSTQPATAVEPVEQPPVASVATAPLPQTVRPETNGGQAAGPAPSAVSTPTQQPPRPTQPAAARELGLNEEAVPVPPLRKMIADRMVQSMFTIPHATTNAEVDMTAVVRYRDARKDEFKRREGASLSLVAFVIKATVEALKEFPMVNAEWAGDTIILKRDININVAVDAPDGLTTPVIHHADDKSLTGLSKAIYDLAIRARNKKLKIEDMQGGTFTVNNTGALGSTGGVSIINYPQGGILAAAAVVKRPVVIEGDSGDVIAIRSMMNVSFSFDHRLLDGGYATSFVNAIKSKLENWSQEYPLY